MSDAPDIKPQQSGQPTLVGCLAVGLGGLLLIALCVPAIEQARSAARRSQAKNNLKQIGLALHNYHDTSSTLPPGGVFNAEGTPFHCWTTAIEPYLSASPWYIEVDFNVPWDHPKQIDHFLMKRYPVWEDPRVSTLPRSDGLPVTIFAANAWLFYRNSFIELKKIGDLSNTLLAAEARGNYLPLGCPGNWRNVTDGLNGSPETFGFPENDATLVLIADGSVRAINPDLDPVAWNALSGAETLRPAPDRLQRVPYPYELPTDPEWLLQVKQIRAGVSVILKGNSWKDWLEIDFKQAMPPDEKNPHWKSTPPYPAERLTDELIVAAAKRRHRDIDEIEEVRIRGSLDASELEPILKLKNLKYLKLSKADIRGDVAAFRKRLKPSVKVDQTDPAVLE